jgi:hypothetical protein
METTSFLSKYGIFINYDITENDRSIMKAFFFP